MKGYYLYLLKRAEKECADKTGGIFEGIGRVMGLGGKFSAGFIAILVYFDYFLFTEGFGFSPAQFLQYLYGLNPLASSHLALFVLFYVIVAVTFFVFLYFIDRVGLWTVDSIIYRWITVETCFFLMLLTVVFICIACILTQEYCLVISYLLLQLFFSVMLYRCLEKSIPIFVVRVLSPVIVMITILIAKNVSINFIVAYLYIMLLLWIIEILYYELSKPQQFKTGSTRMGLMPLLLFYLGSLLFLIVFYSQNRDSWRDIEKDDFSFNLMLNREFLSPISYDSSVRICVEPNIQKALSDAKDLVVLKRDDKICGGSAIDSADFKNGRYLPVGSNTFLYLSQDEKRALYMIVERRVNKFERRYYLAAASLKNFDP